MNFKTIWLGSKKNDMGATLKAFSNKMASLSMLNTVA